MEARIEVGIGQLAHRRFQLEHGEHLPQLIVYLTGDARLFFLAHAFQVRRQLTQLLLGAGQGQLNALAFGDIPDDSVPDYPAVTQAAGDRLDLGPPFLPLTGEDSPLPGPVPVGVQRLILSPVIIGPVVRVHQVAQAHVRMTQDGR
ncbi:hypothetical protein D3C80_1685840 [compost metagenome]